jgi:type VI secretion system protein ImpK
MRLIDCFADVIALTAQQVESINAGGAQPEYDEVSLSIRKTLIEHARDYIAWGYTEEQYKLAKFSVVAYIDEAILSSRWDSKEKWRRELLQVSEFKTVNAGEDFFTHLNNLSPVTAADSDIREVYYYCLMFGFCGKYFDTDDRQKLEEIKNTTRRLLTGEGRRSLDLLDGRLFPEAYTDGRKEYTLPGEWNYRSLIVGVPIIAFIILFFLFRTQIIITAEDLVRNLVTNI